MSTLLQDLRYALRQWRHNPGFTAMVIVVLALGIGVTATMFSFVDAVILHTLPYQHPEQLVLLNEERVQKASSWHIENGVSAPNYLDIAQDNHSFQDVGYYRYWNGHLGDADSHDIVWGQRISPNLLNVFGVQPILGRGFTPADAEAGHDRIVILGFGFWQKKFGGRHDVLGQTIRLDGKSYTVAGVMPQDFVFIYDSDVSLLLPLGFSPKELSDSARVIRSLGVLARLKPGVTLEQAGAEMQALALHLAELHPETNKTWGFRVQSLHASYYSENNEYIEAFAGAVFLVLLLACVNVASLMLSRASARRREAVVRLAMGASRGRFVRQLLTESVLLGIAGGVLGIGVAVTGIRLLVYGCTHSYMYFPGIQWVGVNAHLLAFCFLVAVITGVLFGLAPALHSSKINLAGALKEGGLAVTAERSGRLLQDGLVVCEVALAVVLLATAGLLVRSFVKVVNAPLGFEPNHLISTNFSVPDVRNARGEQEVTLFSDVLSRIKSIPAVRSAAFGSAAPEMFAGMAGDQVFIATEGQPRPAPGHEASIPLRSASPGFIKALGVPLLAGRDFTEADVAGSTPVAIISKGMADRFWPHSNPLGMHVTVLGSLWFPERPKKERVVEVVGVIGNYVTFSYLNIEKHSLLLLPFAQYPDPTTTFVVRSEPPPQTLVPALRAIMQSVNKEQTTQEFVTWDQLVQNVSELRMRRLPLTIVGIFASLALLLTAVGIFGVISYSVSLRSHEMAIRMSLGAQQINVMRMVVGEGIRVALVGLGVGLAGTWALGRILASYLYQVPARDPLTFCLVALVILGVAILAAIIPARRATKVDPMVALRYE